MKSVLIMGSAPDAVRALDFDCSKFAAIVAINNAWRIRKDWTHCVFPEDFLQDRRPQASAGKSLVEYDHFVPANNAFGGVIYAGGTMAFTAGYWVLHTLKPDLLAFIGCDMVYDDTNEKTHFYGHGDADPLRDDPTLQSLEAKANRLCWMAFEQKCLCVNLSRKPRSRLTFDRLDASTLNSGLDAAFQTGFKALDARVDQIAAARALEAETTASCFVESGDYWNAPEPLDSIQLAAIDALWLGVFKKRQVA